MSAAVRSKGQHPRAQPAAAPVNPSTRIVGLVIAAAALAGCASGPDHERPSVPLPAQWREPMPVAAAGMPPAVGEAALLDQAWWRAFGDARIGALVDAALESNKDLQIAAWRVQEYDARVQVSRAARLPEVGYGSEALRTRISQRRPVDLPLGVSPSQSQFQLSGNVAWEIDFWGRVKRSNEAALAELLSTDEARRGVMLSVVASVVSSYLQLSALDQQLGMAQAIVDNREQVLALVQQRFDGGAANGMAVAQAQADLASARAPLPGLRRQIGELENALSLLLGRNPGPIERGPIDALAEPAVPAGLPSELLWRRPDLLAAEQTLIAANARIGVAKAAYLPTISLTTVFGFASNELETLLNRSANFGQIGPSLLGTIFSGGRIAGNVREAEAVQRQRLLQYQQAVQAALRDVDDALSARARLIEQTAQLQEWSDALDRLVQLTRARHEGGVGNRLEVLDAERELLAAQGERARSRSDTVVALVSIYKAMGGGWMDAPEMPLASDDTSALATLKRLR